jgi:hypothetical protein
VGVFFYYLYKVFSYARTRTGKWLKKMAEEGVFFYCKDRIGHQALGYAVFFFSRALQ